VTVHPGYALARDESLLSLKVTGQQSNGLITVVDGRHRSPGK
jgi:hypothetical protein